MSVGGREARRLYLTLGNYGQRQLRAWCAANKSIVDKIPGAVAAAESKTVEEGTAILRRVVSMSEFEALHSSLAELLSGSDDNTASIDKTLVWIRTDLKQGCKLVSS